MTPASAAGAASENARKPTNQGRIPANQSGEISETGPLSSRGCEKLIAFAARSNPAGWGRRTSA